MLRTMLLPEPLTPALAQHLLRSRDDIVEFLKRLRHSKVMLTCFIDGGFVPAGARIDAIMPSVDELVLAAVSEMEHEMLSAANAITVVAFLRGVKIQFAAAIGGTIATASGIGVRVSLPTRMLHLQRRVHARARTPRMRPLECMVRGETNLPSEQRLIVLDIGVGGVALLARARDMYASGERLLNCGFNLGREGQVTTDLIVRHVARAEGSGGWRYGCAFADITPRALERVCCYVEGIEAQRRAAVSINA